MDYTDSLKLLIKIREEMVRRREIRREKTDNKMIKMIFKNKISLEEQ